MLLQGKGGPMLQVILMWSGEMGVGAGGGGMGGRGRGWGGVGVLHGFGLLHGARRYIKQQINKSPHR